MDTAGIAGRLNEWARHFEKLDPQRLSREEPLRAELLRQILKACFGLLTIQSAALAAIRVEWFWFFFTTVEPAILLAIVAWSARKRQTHLATVLLLVALSHMAAFVAARLEHLEFTGVLLLPSIVVCGLLVGHYFVLKWTAVCCGLIAWVTMSARADWRIAVAWSAAYLATAWLVMLFSRHMERLLETQVGAIVAERTRFAREIHDTLAQGFTGIMMQLNAAEQRIEGDAAGARQHLEKARELARQSLDEARRSVSALRPASLEGGSLLAAIERLGQQVTSASGISLHTVMEGAPYALSEEREAHLLRIAQEALTNAVRHGAPRRIDVRLRYHAQTVVLEVRDDGRGMDGQNTPGFGLENMRSRAREIGAEFRILSEAGQGTCIVTTLPTA